MEASLYILCDNVSPITRAQNSQPPHLFHSKINHIWKGAIVMPHIISLNIGTPQKLQFQGKEIETGLFKESVNKPLYLSTLNFEGDGQADLKHHGGRDKAVCVYAFEHYPYWEQELSQPLPYGVFGENLTITGLLESDVCIGNIYKIGGTLVQVTQPRQPCYKLSYRYNRKDFPLLVQDTGFTGFYVRVLQEGTISPSDEIILTEQNEHHNRLRK